MSGFFRRLFKRNRDKVAVEFNSDDLKILRWYAERKKLSLEEFIHRAVMASVPQNASSFMEGERRGIAVLDEAFDDEDIGVEIWKDHKPFCAHLDQKAAAEFEGCRGVCTSAERVGEGGRAPCYWPNKSEFRCPYFADARKPKRNRIAV